MAVSRWSMIGLVILSFATGCGNEPGGTAAEFKSLPAAAIPQAATEQQVRIEPQNGALLRMRIEMDGRTALMARMTNWDTIQTFLTADPISFTLNDGRLVETRGLSFDLMSAEPGPPLAALKGGEVYLRRWQVIAAEDAIRDIRLDCSAGVSHVNSARHIEENCRGGEFSIVNRFVIISPQTLAWSRQWIGPGGGYVVVQQP